MTENNNMPNGGVPNNDTVKETKDTFNLVHELLDWFFTIALALAIALCIKAFLFDIVRVDGPSMYPTLVNNDRLLVTKIGYKPQRGDIIILDSTYKDRVAFYKEYEETNNTKLNVFSKCLLYFQLDHDLKRRFYVKRIIGMPGDTVDIQDGKVLVNGEVLDEPYYDGVTGITDYATEYPFTVSDDCVFVMGDNRPNSKDSRSTSLGEVPIKAISGKSQLRLWPLNSVSVTK